MKSLIVIITLLSLSGCWFKSSNDSTPPIPNLEPIPPEVIVPPVVPTERTIHDKVDVDYSEGVIHRSDFENRVPGDGYNKNDFKEDTRAAWVANLAAEMVNRDGSIKLKVTIPAGKHKHGLSSTRNLDNYDELYYSYEIEFKEGYDFSIGGKLPGLAGRATSRVPDGCKPVRVNQGFSLRSMFREDGRAIIYMYHQNNPLRNRHCGEEVSYMHNGQPFKFIAGKTYVVEQFVKMNDAQQENGIVTIHVNGFKVIDLTGMVFSQDGRHGINYAFFQFWHGGSTPRWAPSIDSTVYFDNITISERSLTY